MKKVISTGVLFLTAITLLYGFKRVKRAETEILISECPPGPPDSGASEMSLRQKRCDEKACDPEDTITMSGATHTTETTAVLVRMPRGRLAIMPATSVDNLSLSKFPVRADLRDRERDRFGYPYYDPRIDGSRTGSNWYRPKRKFKGFDKHGVAFYAPPSIGSSGEIDCFSLGRSRSNPENQPEWSYHTSSTDSIVIPKSDDARYY